MAGGPLQAADDMVRIMANGLTFGAADHIASALGEKDTAAKTKAARDRAGIAGDLADVGSMFVGGKGALKLGFEGLKAIPKLAGAVVSKKGLGLGALGLAGLADYNARTSADAAPSPQKPQAVAKPADVTKEVAEHVAGAKAAQAQQPAGFDGMVARLAAGQNGMISLRQLGALSDAAQRSSQADYYSKGGSAKQPAPGDLAGRILEQQYMDQYQRALQDPKADKEKAAQQFEDKTLQLRKTQFNDPYGLRDGSD